MSSKVILLVIAASSLVTTSFTLFGDEIADKKELIRKRIKEANRKNRLNGGLVYSQPEGYVFEIINRQSLVSEAELKKTATAITRTTQIPISFVKEKTAKAGATLEIVASESDPLIVSIMDEGWAKANFARLNSDNPDPAKLTERASKQLWRAVGAAMGVGVSTFQPCLMRNIRNMRELDACKVRQPGPASLNCFKESSEYFGIMPIKIASYRSACQEGWAPAPTNDIQRVIWDQAHTPPSKPMKITYDKDKQKSVVK